MMEDMGHGQEVRHLAFVETDLPLIASYNSRWAAKGQRTHKRLETEDSLCLHALEEEE